MCVCVCVCVHVGGADARTRVCVVVGIHVVRVCGLGVRVGGCAGSIVPIVVVRVRVTD